MYVKVEPSGTCEYGGLVQVRFSMYLDEKDFGYEKHLVTLTEGGKVFDPLSDKSVDEPVKTVTQVNPFHNHFCYFAPDTPADDITAVGEAFMHEAYFRWVEGMSMSIVNPPFKFNLSATKEDLEACATKVKQLCDAGIVRAYDNLD